MKQPQLFMKIGPNKYVPVERPWPDHDIYAWDDSLQRIILKERFSRPNKEVPPVSGWGHFSIVEWPQWCFSSGVVVIHPPSFREEIG